MKYVIIKKIDYKTKNETLNLQRFTNEIWEKVEKNLSKELIIYVTDDILDEKLKDFENIYWDSYYDKIRQCNRKISIKFTPDDIITMNETSEKIKQTEETKIENELKEIIERKFQKRIAKKQTEEYEKKYQENLAEHREKVEEMNKIIPLDMDDYEAMMKWKNMEFQFPPSEKIKAIKNSYNDISWKEFINIVKKI